MLEYTFYDNEATGLSTRHDQVTQFGGITCDESFRIKESISKFVRLLSYVVPHPSALKVTRKTAADLCDPRLVSEYGAAREISRFLTPNPGTTRVFVTYNGIKYDDELLRTMLYRNLQEPYFNSGRDAVKIDLLDVVRLVAAVAPGLFEVPKTPEGRLNFRLEAICPANGIELEAHDAYHDAVATMKLFKLVQERAPWAIELALVCGSPKRVGDLLTSSLTTGEPLFSFKSFGASTFSPLAILAYEGKKFIGFDLRGEISTESPTGIAEQLYKPGTPFQIVTTNKFPLLLSASGMRAVHGAELPDSIRERASEINRKTEFRQACRLAMSLNTVEKVNDPVSEEMIYDGFYGHDDKQKITEFNRATSWDARTAITFRDKRLRDFSARIILEAASMGGAALPSEAFPALAADCAEALCRPFQGADSRYTTIARCLADGADDEWVEWAMARYGSHPVFETCNGIEPERLSPPGQVNSTGQMTFGF